MNNVLELPDVQASVRQETHEFIHYEAQSTAMPGGCPSCGSIRIKKHGLSRPGFINDTPRYGKPAGFWLRQQRVRCLEPECGAATTVRPEWLHPTFRATSRLIQAVQRDALELTFSHVARQYGIDIRTVRDVFAVYAEQLNKDRGRLFAPTVLGIDETWLHGQPALVLTDIEKATVLEMYPTRDYDVLATILSDFREQRGVRVVAMDMHKPYRTVVRRELPDAVIVVDKFHVIRMADYAIDMYRRALQAHNTTPKPQQTRLKKLRHFMKSRPARMTVFQWGRMQLVQKDWPELYEVWDVRNRFYAIYDLTDRRQAEERYDALVDSLSPPLRTAFRPLLTAMKNWRGEVFGYFDQRYTNAATEALNGLIKVLNRNGRGYSFEIIRVKVLFAPRHQRRTTIRSAYYCTTPSTPEQLAAMDEHFSHGAFLPGVLEELTDTLGGGHDDLS